jgi:hypothetical protein
VVTVLQQNPYFASPQFAQATHDDGATNINSNLFGLITTTGSFRGATPRIGQLGARLTF